MDITTDTLGSMNKGKDISVTVMENCQGPVGGVVGQQGKNLKKNQFVGGGATSLSQRGKNLNKNGLVERIVYLNTLVSVKKSTTTKKQTHLRPKPRRWAHFGCRRPH